MIHDRVWAGHEYRDEYLVMLGATRKCHHKLELERGREDARGTIAVAGICYRVIASDSMRGYMAVALPDPAIADLPAFPAIALQRGAQPLHLTVAPGESHSADYNNDYARGREQRFSSGNAEEEEEEYYEGGVEPDDDTIDAATGLSFADLRALDLQPGSIRALEYDADTDHSAAATASADEVERDSEFATTRGGVTFLTDFGLETPVAAGRAGRPQAREHTRHPKPSVHPKAPRNANGSSLASQAQLASARGALTPFKPSHTLDPTFSISSRELVANKKHSAGTASTRGARSRQGREESDWGPGGMAGAEAVVGVDQTRERNRDPFERHAQWAQAREERAGYSLCVSRTRVVVGFHGARIAPAACNYRVMLLGDFVRLVLAI